MSRFRALPYAKALHELILSQDPGRADFLIDELERLAEAVTGVPEFHRVLVTPMVSVETKTAILDQVLDALEITQPCRRFVHVVQQHYRMQHLPTIAASYRELVDRSMGRTRATVEVATRLEDSQRRQILEVMAELVGSEVIAEFEENPDLLAGFRVQVGSKVFDGSLVGQLDRLSRETLIEQG